MSIAGLVREKVDRALESAVSPWTTRPRSSSAGTRRWKVWPARCVADALAAHGKPVFRVHTAGSVGGSTTIVAAQHVTSGVHGRVLAIAFEKQSDGNAMWALSVAIPFGMPVHAGAGGYFSPIVRTYIARYDVPRHIGAMVAVKDRANALKNPYAHLHEEGLTLEKAMESPMLWDPIRFVETLPVVRWSIAMVLANETTATLTSRAARAPGRVVHAMAMRSEPTMFAGREQVSPVAGEMCAASCAPMPHHPTPRRYRRREMYVPFSWVRADWLENLGFAPKAMGGAGWRTASPRSVDRSR